MLATRRNSAGGIETQQRSEACFAKDKGKSSIVILSVANSRGKRLMYLIVFSILTTTSGIGLAVKTTVPERFPGKLVVICLKTLTPTGTMTIRWSFPLNGNGFSLANRRILTIARPTVTERIMAVV